MVNGADPKDYEEYPDEKEIIRGMHDVIVIEHKKIPAILNDKSFDRAFKLYNRWKRFGLPNGKGSRQEREVVLRVIEIIDQELQHIYNPKKEE